MFISLFLYYSSSFVLDGENYVYHRAQYIQQTLDIIIPEGKVAFVSFSSEVDQHDIFLTIDDQPVSIAGFTRIRGFEIHGRYCNISTADYPIYIQVWILNSTVCSGTSYMVQGSRFLATAHSFTNHENQSVCIFPQSSFRALTIIQNVRGYNSYLVDLIGYENISDVEDFSTIEVCNGLDCVHALQEPFFILLNGSIINYELMYKYYTEVDPVYDEEISSSFLDVTSSGISNSTISFFRITMQDIGNNNSGGGMSEGTIMGIILGSITVIGIFILIALCILKCCIGYCNCCMCCVPKSSLTEPLNQFPEPENPESQEAVQTAPIQVNIHPIRSKAAHETILSSINPVPMDSDTHPQEDKGHKEDQELYQV